MRIVLAHDWLCGYRGGEAVLDRIARAFAAAGHEVAGLYVMVDDGRPLTEAIDALPRIASRLQRIPGAAERLRRWMLPLYPWAVASLSSRLARDHARTPIDLLVSTSSAAIKGLRAPDGVPHLCYCHSPARYLWSQADAYGRGRAGGLRALGLRVFGERLRRWDAASSANVTAFVANSTRTAAEVLRCYGRHASVVHPPVRTAFFTPPPPSATREDFWLLAGALEPYKRADLAIEAARRARARLVVAGTGSQRRALERFAGAHARFLGRVGDEALRRLYRTARVLVFPQVEDFGIVAAEALACGLPVAARRAGGALDIVTDGVTGALFDEPSADALALAVKRAPDPATAGAACRAAAERFSEARFDREILAEIDRLVPR